MTNRTVAILVASQLLLSACATYRPPDLPRDQIAILSLIPPGGMRRIIFREIDEKPLTTASALGLTNIKGPVKLAPGKHTVRVNFAAGLSKGDAHLWLVAEPSKAYGLGCANAGYKFRCWIEDKESGKPVGGVVGGSDEPD